MEIETNALDLAKAEREGEGPTVMALRVMHTAAMRQRVEGVPAKFETFLEALDEFDELDDDEGDDDESDPTRAAGSVTPP